MSTSTTITESIFDAQTQALGLAKKGTESAVKAVESWTEFLSTQAKAILPESVDLDAMTPAMDTFPTPTKAIESSFGFMEDLIAQQRDLTTKFVGSLEDMAGSITGAGRSTKATAGRSTKATASK